LRLRAIATGQRMEAARPIPARAAVISLIDSWTRYGCLKFTSESDWCHRVMGLSWRDLVSSIAMVAIVWVFIGNQARASMPLISTVRAASAVDLVLAAGCATAAAWDLHTMPQQGWGLIVRRFTTVTGAIALIGGLLGLVAGSGHALEFLVVAMTLLWLAATCWHISSIGAEE
jgi:hypothetical protein